MTAGPGPQGLFIRAPMTATLKNKRRSTLQQVIRIKKLKRIRTILASSKDELRKKYKVRALGIFGSYARGEQKKSSDLDILVKFNSNATLFDFVGLGNYLEEKLKIKVDVVSEKGVRPELKNHILREVVKV